MDLIELTEAFLAAKQHAFAPNTRRAYRYDLLACDSFRGFLWQRSPWLTCVCS